MIQLLGLIVLGAIGGFVATRLMGVDMPPMQTVAVGVLGAIVGGFLFNAVLSFLGVLALVVGAVLGTMVLIFAFQAVMKGR